MLEVHAKGGDGYPVRLTNSSLLTAERETFEHSSPSTASARATSTSRAATSRRRGSVPGSHRGDRLEGKLGREVETPRRRSIASAPRTCSGHPGPRRAALPHDFDLGEHWVDDEAGPGGGRSRKVLAVVFRGVGE